MNREAVAVLAVLAMLLAGAQVTTFVSANPIIDPGSDLPRIYIRADGNVEPSTVPIQRQGDLYQLTVKITHYTVEIQHRRFYLCSSV